MSSHATEEAERQVGWKPLEDGSFEATVDIREGKDGRWHTYWPSSKDAARAYDLMMIWAAHNRGEAVDESELNCPSSNYEAEGTPRLTSQQLWDKLERERKKVWDQDRARKEGLASIDRFFKAKKPGSSGEGGQQTAASAAAAAAASPFESRGLATQPAADQKPSEQQPKPRVQQQLHLAARQIMVLERPQHEPCKGHQLADVPGVEYVPSRPNKQWVCRLPPSGSTSGTDTPPGEAGVEMGSFQRKKDAELAYDLCLCWLCVVDEEETDTLPQRAQQLLGEDGLPDLREQLQDIVSNEDMRKALQGLLDAVKSWREQQQAAGSKKKRKQAGSTGASDGGSSSKAARRRLGATNQGAQQQPQAEPLPAEGPAAAAAGSGAGSERGAAGQGQQQEQQVGEDLQHAQNQQEQQEQPQPIDWDQMRQQVQRPLKERLQGQSQQQLPEAACQAAQQQQAASMPHPPDRAAAAAAGPAAKQLPTSVLGNASAAQDRFGTPGATLPAPGLTTPGILPPAALAATAATAGTAAAAAAGAAMRGGAPVSPAAEARVKLEPVVAGGVAGGGPGQEAGATGSLPNPQAGSVQHPPAAVTAEPGVGSKSPAVQLAAPAAVPVPTLPAVKAEAEPAEVQAQAEPAMKAGAAAVHANPAQAQPAAAAAGCAPSAAETIGGSSRPAPASMAGTGAGAGAVNAAAGAGAAGPSSAPATPGARSRPQMLLELRQLLKDRRMGLPVQDVQRFACAFMDSDDDPSRAECWYVCMRDAADTQDWAQVQWWMAELLRTHPRHQQA